MKDVALRLSNPQFLTRSVKLGLSILQGKSLPFSATFILTHRCNFRCAYCDIPDAADQEMTKEEFCGAIDELVSIGMARASFSGGEALLRADAIEIIRHARSRGMTTSLNSNAWLAESKLDELASCLDMLVLSLDGPEPTHDLVRKRRGSYDRVVRTLEGARKRGLATATITVLTPANLHVIETVLEIAEQQGCWAYFQPAYRDCFAHERGLDPALTPRVLQDVADRLRTERSLGRRVGASPGYLDRLERAPTFGDCSKCAAGRFFGTVMPDGVVVPCHLTSGDHPYLNGRKVGFARAFLDMPRPKSGPGCAISPYQESDLIFGTDVRAVLAALERVAKR